MRPDQANDLRNLVIHAARVVAAPEVPPPKIIVVAGGKGGVGTTTVAVNSAVALARAGHRVVLVDADFAGPNVAEMCGLEGAYGAADVLAGRRTVHEVLLRGPIGIQVLPAHRDRVDADDCTPPAQERLIAQLLALGPHADYVVIDAGSGGSRAMRRFWETAHRVLLVTQPDDVAIMDSYALVKQAYREQPPTAPLSVVVNGADDATAARQVYQRIDRACRRFLGFTPAGSVEIPIDPTIAQPAKSFGAAATPFERLVELVEGPTTEEAALPQMHFHRRTSIRVQ